MKQEQKYLFDNPKNISRLLYIFYACCLLLLIFDFVIHRHTSHYWENLLGFYPLFGFLGCVVLVLIASWLRRFLMRSEDYYQSYQPDIKQSPILDKENSSGARHVDD